MLYYIEKPFSNYPKNELEKAITAMLLEYDRFVFPLNRLSAVKESINRAILKLNDQHKRGHRITGKWGEENFINAQALKISKTHKDWSLWLSSSHNIALKIILCKEEKDL